MFPDNVYCVGVIILQGVFMKIFQVFFGGLFSLVNHKISTIFISYGNAI